MNNTNQKRYYSPQFSEKAAVSVRRLASIWGHMKISNIEAGN